jgi:signal transduction histidine kinase
MTPISAPEEVGALWLLTLQRAVGRASHDVKDALNGVSVNLEVIRSRAARPDTPASAVLKFGEAAGQQLERLTTLIEAVLGLAKADRAQPDVAVTLKRVVAVCGASASSADAAIRLTIDPGVESTGTTVPGDVVRLALASILLELAVGTDRAMRAPDIFCTLTVHAGGVEVVIAMDGRQPAMPEAIAEVVRANGLRWAEGRNSMSLTFPRA